MTDTTVRTPSDHELLQESLGLLAPRAGELIAAFYGRLFAEHPALRPMFPPVMDDQRDKLLKAIIALVTHYKNPPDLVPALSALGRGHAGYAVRLEHYAAVGDSLLAVLADFAGPHWTPQYQAAWERAYTFAAGTMMQAQATAPARAASAA
jgi:methyl-accepting chemotaxis protein